MRTYVIIPAFNEKESIPLVLNSIPRHLVHEVIVTDNASTDGTGEIAAALGATVIKENVRGYGSACLAGMNYVLGKELQPDVIIFLDADFSDHPEEMEQLLSKINEGYDFVLGSRVKSKREKGSMMPQQVFGNWLATRLIKMRFGVKYYDLGPFRAIKYDKLKALNMTDKNYGWTVEMQIKAIKQNLKWCEVPVSYRKRKGDSKISGTVKGTILAGYKIIKTIFKYR